ncbi:hypothetical protein, partial [Halomicronema sp. CCY15110]|uniref:hypothetical protein n=1 Tax=Halomicronema sp. CCY15110 TaxID=2767773 RepID=UPI00194F0FC2
WPERVPPATVHQYAVIYLSLQSAACNQETPFYAAVAQRLAQCQTVPDQTAWQRLWQAPSFTRMSFAEAVRQARAMGILPVLCLDEFEQLFEHREQFDDRFYDSLRDLMNSCALMLITASRRLLDEYRNEHKLTSSFFNLGQCVRLGRFSDWEAQQLVALPEPAQAALSAPHQQHALQWGQRHPLLLQLAGQKLWEAQQSGYAVSWAQRQFRPEAARLHRELRAPRNWPRPLYWLVFQLPEGAGGLANRSFNGLERLLQLGPIPAIAIIALLVATGLITQQQLQKGGALWQQIREALGLS